MNNLIVALWVALGMGVANFAYQAVTGQQHWDLAIERTWFQTVACIAMAISLNFSGRTL